MKYDSIEITMRKRINYFRLIDKTKQKNMLRKKLTQFNGYLKPYGLCFKNIEITNIEAVERFDLRIEKNMTTNSVGICQAARDLGMISEASYNKEFCVGLKYR